LKTSLFVVGFTESSGANGETDKQRRRTMGKKGEVYRCDICGQVVEVVEGGDGELVCCGEPMIKE
jgi:desulfoferrodoxin-like iron-binding protein